MAAMPFFSRTRAVPRLGDPSAHLVAVRPRARHRARAPKRYRLTV